MTNSREVGAGGGMARNVGMALLVAAGPAAIAVGLMTVAAFRVPPPAPPPALRSVPVLVVPGWFDEAADVAPLVARLVDAGWPPDHVSAVDFADPVGSNEDHAVEIGHALADLRSRTGAARIDIVAHSMGGLAVRTLLADPHRAAEVRRVVFLGTPQRGTWAAYLAWGEGGEEMEPESDFLEWLNRQPPVPPEVEALTIRTPLDTHVVPGGSATLPGVPDVEVCCPTHPGLVDDRQVFRAVLAFLAEGRRLDPDPIHR